MIKALQLIWAEVEYPGVIGSTYNRGPNFEAPYWEWLHCLARPRRVHVSSHTVPSLLLAPEDHDLSFKPSWLIGSPELDIGLAILKVRGRPLGLSTRLGARGRCLPRARPPT